MRLLVLVFFLVFNTACTKKRNYETKVLKLAAAAKVKGLDPVNAGDTYSSNNISRIYEGLLEYHYLKRPYELQPNLAESMPKVSGDGLIYTFKIKKGVKFHDNKCFPKGVGRELIAEDFVYSIKRMADAKNISTGWWLLDGKIKGLNEWRDKYKKSDANYNDKIEGLQALDKYTLQFKLTQQYPQFLYSLAMVYTFAVPREAVEMYKEEFLNNPVGTGPFISGVYRQTNKIIFTKNPNYRVVYYPSEGSDEDRKRGFLKDAGKRLPLVDRIEVMIQPESQPRWLGFESGRLDMMEIPKDNFDSVVTPDKKITDTYSKKGIDLRVVPDLDITYIAFNHDNPLFRNKKLRQAMSLAYNTEESNKLFYSGRGVIAQSIIPPGIAGFDPDYANPYQKYDLEKAKKLLAEAGYPGGKGLPEMTYDTTATTISRQTGEYLKNSMEKIGVKIKVVTNTWPQLTQKVKKRHAQLYGMAWLGDYPDAENFLQLLYGPNASPGPNGSNYNNPEFNRRFEIAKNMQPSPERRKKYEQLAKFIGEETPIIFNLHRTVFVALHGWLKNYKFSTFSSGANAKYYNIDLKVKQNTIESGKLKN